MVVLPTILVEVQLCAALKGLMVSTKDALPPTSLQMNEGMEEKLLVF
jgi:hypothetical protein